MPGSTTPKPLNGITRGFLALSLLLCIVFILIKIIGLFKSDSSTANLKGSSRPYFSGQEGKRQSFDSHFLFKYFLDRGDVLIRNELHSLESGDSRVAGAHGWALLARAVQLLIKEDPDAQRVFKFDEQLSNWSEHVKNSPGGAFAFTQAYIALNTLLTSPSPTVQKLASELGQEILGRSSILLEYHKGLIKTENFESTLNPMMSSWLIFSLSRTLELLNSSDWIGRFTLTGYFNQNNRSQRELTTKALTEALLVHLSILNRLTDSSQYVSPELFNTFPQFECFRSWAMNYAAAATNKVPRMNTFPLLDKLKETPYMPGQFMSSQNLLPCLELLADQSSDSAALSAIEEHVAYFINPDWTQRCHPNLRSSQAMLSLSNNLLNASDCDKNSISLADNAWLASIIARFKEEIK